MYMKKIKETKEKFNPQFALDGEEDIQSIRYKNGETTKILIQASANREFALIATLDEAIVTNFEKKKQKILNHLSESTVRAIYRFGEDQFLTVSAQDFDDRVTLQVSDGSRNKRIKLQMRFVDGETRFHDLIYDEKKNSLQFIYSRDEENFVLSEYENFKELKFST